MGLLRSPDGKIVDIADDQADLLISGGYTPVTEGEAGGVTGAMARPDSGALGGVGAFASSSLSGATLGLSDLALKGFLDRGDFDRLAADRENHPIVSGIGQVAGTLATSFANPGSFAGSLPAGVLSHAAADATAAARGIGGAGGALAAFGVSGVEGSIYNAGAYLSDTALGDRELSAEGLAGALGSGFEFGTVGGVAALGIEQGSIAARRMFSRLTDGGNRAALQAEQAWTAKYQATIEANDAAADIARARLAEAQLSRQHAGLARDRAGVAELEARAASARAPAPAVAREQQIVGASAAPPPSNALAPEDAARLFGLDFAPKAGLSEAAERELKEALAGHDAARSELETMLQRLESPEVGVAGGSLGRPGVPVGEFGAPGARGFAPGEVPEPSLPAVAEAATGDVTAVGRPRPRPDGTPVGSHDLTRELGPNDSGLTFDPETRSYFTPVEAKASAPGMSEMLDGVRAMLKEDGSLGVNKIQRTLGIGHERAQGLLSEARAGMDLPRVTGQRHNAIRDEDYLANREAFEAKLSQEERQAISVYTSSTYKDINRSLRHGEVRNGREKFISQIDNAVAKSSLHDNATLYRGLSGDEADQFRKLKVGDVFEEKAFTSTSSSPDAFKRDVNLHIEVPAGYPAAPVPSAIAEKEWLLRRNTRFSVLRVADDGATRSIHVRVSESPAPRPVGEMVSAKTGRQTDAPPLHVIRRGAPVEVVPSANASPASDTLTGLLRGTQEGLSAGKGISELGAASRAEYATAKAAKTGEAAEHFRAKANAAREVRADPETDLERALRDTRDQLNVGGSLRAISGAPMVSERVAAHPLAVQQLETAHETAVARAAAAVEPAERVAAEREIATIERQLTSVGARPGAVEDVAAVAEVATKYERSSARLAEALGVDAPPAALESAKAVRAAEDAAERKTMDRTVRAIDDHADQPGRVMPWEEWKRDKLPDYLRRHGYNSTAMQAMGADYQAYKAAALRGTPAGQAAGEALAAKLDAGAALARSRIAETEARISSRAADKLAKDTRATAEAARPPGAVPARGKGAIGTIATAVGVAGELGVPGIPKPHDIPVIGPLLGVYLKYRAIKAAAGRFSGRVPATADARAAALVARTKDRIATAVDRTLGLAAKPAARTAVVSVAAVLGHRAFDDGEPDAPKGASAQAQAAVRIREIAAAAARPELVAQHVRKQLRGVADPDLIAAAEKHMTARFQYLASVMPKMPPPDPFSKTEWQPSPAAADELAQRLTVAHDPEAVFKVTTPATVDTVRNIYPRVLDLAKQRLMERVSDTRDPITYQEQLRGSLLFGMPLSPSMVPESIAILQGAHAKMRPTPAPQPTSPPTPSIAGPVGVNQLYDPGNQRRAARM